MAAVFFFEESSWCFEILF